MNTSDSADDNVLSEARPLPHSAAQLQMRLDIDKMRDCLQRAADGLERDDAADIDWMYVGGQMIIVVQYADRCCDQCSSQDAANDDNAGPVTPIVGTTSTDPFLPTPGARDDEGGVA